ncbi:MAG: FAD-dependent oxidoreductase [Dysgonamonadaceae bacterium]|jgi:NADPH-dependent 2,4-dienoyl-CoA reductase/sulfur reductase-like enzyme/rhodanese-related sulfurtransferase|nr:FAD-dependent oxidoreductase [Dysgonamonadaceae bacterium]
MKTVIIGGVAGGATAAERLRRLDEKAEIVMLERGGFISYANCGLPYYIGGEITDKEELTLQTPESFKARFNIDVRINNEALSVNSKDKTLTVKNLQTGKTYTEKFDKLILSPGASPARPPIDGMNSKRVFTLRNIPDTYAIKNFIDAEKPKSAVVVGGGFIGLEMAENLHNAGLQVSIVEFANQVLAPIDFDMACAVHQHIRSKGVELLLGNGVKTIVENTDKSLIVNLINGSISADMVIMAVGVKPDIAFLKDSGIALNERGYIITNEKMQTNIADIYAVGDAVEVADFITHQKTMVPLAGPANKQGRIAADVICSISSAYTGTQGSSILKVFDLTVASTGVNEKTANRLGLKYEKSFTVSSSHAGYYPGALPMTIKTVFDPDNDKIIGMQIVGFEGVDKRCDVVAAAIRFGASARDLTQLELCYAPPYSSAKDPVNMAGYVIENIIASKVKIFHWHDVESLDKDKVTLLDVRTKEEFSLGAMPNFKNIPLDEIRERMSEIDRTKPVYLTCQVGLRGYVAARILSQNGFDACNLSDGYAVWKSVMDGSSEIRKTTKYGK